MIKPPLTLSQKSPMYILNEVCDMHMYILWGCIAPTLGCTWSIESLDPCQWLFCSKEWKSGPTISAGVCRELSAATWHLIFLYIRILLNRNAQICFVVNVVLTC